MTTERQDITADFYSGNTKKIRINVVDDNGGPKLLRNAKATFAMFGEKTEVVVLTKSSTMTDPLVGTQITIDDAEEGMMTIHLWPKDTHNMYGTYRYHVNVVDEDGYEETVTTGRINIFKAFAKRPHNANQPAYLHGR